MKYKLTNSQRNFSVANSEYYSALWNHGGIVFFNKVYTYDELNTAFNNLIKNFESLRMCFKNDKTDYSLFLKKYEFKKYPFFCFEAEGEILEASYKFTNSLLNSDDELITCIVFNTPTKSGYIFCAHHIIIDGFSTQIMGKYLNNCLKNNLYSPENIQSYEEYITNEEMYKSSKRYQKDQKFWLQQFSSNPQCSIFEEKKTSFDYESDEVNFRIDPNIFNKIKAFCDSNNISVQSYFNTAYSVYIYRTLGIDFFTLGVPVLNRTTEAELNTIGLYMHIVPLIVKISDESFVQNAINIEDAQMNLFRHQKFTQHDIKELLDAEGKPQNNLFDIATDYQAFEENEDYEFEFVYSNSLSLPLEIHMQSFGKEKHNLKIRYRTSMFSKKEIETMMNSFIAIAEDALENPDKKITELEMLSFKEKQRILVDFNDTAHSYGVPENSTLYSLFEKTAKEKEGKICIRTADKAVTFGELLKNAEKLDVEIRKITDGQKSVIAIIAERSVEMYSAIYGIIRGGNAYLPIDPNYPTERIEYILKNSNAAEVICQGKFTHLAGELPCINMTEFIGNSEKTGNLLPSAADENDTAYVIYTSGSTGNPKGARVSHKSAVNRILWMHEKYPLGKDDVILQKTPYTFDVSVWELFWWGMCGGSLAISKPGEHFLPGKILEEAYNGKVTHLHFVPSVFELFLNYLEAHKDECYKFNSVKHVFLSGEALTASLIQRFYALYDYNSVKLYNLYGPTECAVDVTSYDCTPDDIDPVPIGKPIYNTQVHIVDKHMNILPTGIMGELCIGGVNVGQGYLNNETLTAEKFIDNPFGVGKLYKTGDLAYWREDGNIIFCGRIDSQIKLGGQRIEIGEIESVISNVPEVDFVSVIIRKIRFQNVLVAFYCAKNNIEKKISNVCESKLPMYMVPSVIYRIKEMPLNQSGKLDRKALSAIEINFTKDDIVESPITETEKIICEAFKAILKTDNVGRNSNFFLSGGSSLSMISLLSKDEFDGISAAEFMANPTPVMLAELMDSKRLKKLKYLEPLSILDNSDRALVLLPFAGGGAEAYTNLVNSLKAKDSSLSVYFVRYLLSLEECEEAAKEINEVLCGKEIYFYSHCVGSAVTMQILNFMQSPVKHYIAGASIPPKKTSKMNIWNIVPDKVLRSILVKAGAPLEMLTDEKNAELLRQFRTDTDFAVESLAEKKARIKAPVSVVISKKDIFTYNYKHAEKIWKNYAKDVRNIYFIDSRSHYFQSENSDGLVELILSIIN